MEVTTEDKVALVLMGIMGLVVFATYILGTWGCQPGNIHLAGMC